MYMNDQDAKELGIKDHDVVKVYNDVGSFMINVKTSPAVRARVVIVDIIANNDLKLCWFRLAA